MIQLLMQIFGEFILILNKNRHMKRNIFHGILLFMIQCVLIITSCYGQNSVPVRFVFYNVENLFDVVDDSLTLDEAFTPEGENGWSIKRYHEKLDNIAKTLTALGEWELPALLALCEVENRDVLYDRSMLPTIRPKP